MEFVRDTHARYLMARSLDRIFRACIRILVFSVTIMSGRDRLIVIILSHFHDADSHLLTIYFTTSEECFLREDARKPL
jgi:hypothetical protein